MCHPNHHQIERQIAHFHKIKSHFAKVQLLVSDSSADGCTGV
jgi:hypothetical protein